MLQADLVASRTELETLKASMASSQKVGSSPSLIIMLSISVETWAKPLKADYLLTIASLLWLSVHK